MEIPRRKSSNKKSKIVKSKTNKLFSNMIPAESLKSEPSKPIQKQQKVHSLTKYPKKNITFSTTALLKANLHYLTT